MFTGGIGENSATMRRRISQRLEFLGVRFSDDLNRSAALGPDKPVAEISEPHSRVRLLAVKTDEGLMIARQTARIVRAEDQRNSPKTIPIAVSARHLHLTAELDFNEQLVMPHAYSEASYPPVIAEPITQIENETQIPQATLQIGQETNYRDSPNVYELPPEQSTVTSNRQNEKPRLNNDDQLAPSALNEWKSSLEETNDVLLDAPPLEKLPSLPSSVLEPTIEGSSSNDDSR